MSETNPNANGLSNLTKALGRWDNEGGAATGSPVGPVRALQEADERLLRCLGAAVVLLWNDLPTEIQRDLFESAVAAGDPGLQQDLTQQLGRYLHEQTGD